MALKQQQELKQTFKLSPIQMQVIKLIECNTVELEDKIRQEVEDNPAIEVADTTEEETTAFEQDETLSPEDMILGDYHSEEDIPDYQLYNSSYSNDSRSGNFASADSGASLIDSLLEQIKLQEFDNRKRTIAEYIIGNIDENGYLQRDLPSIINDIYIHQHLEISSLEMEDMLYEIQDLDPAGVGARDLQESLLLQLQRKETTDDIQTALAVIETCFDEFSNKHYDKIIRQLNISEDQLRRAVDEIVSLNPKPGNAWSDAMEMAMSNITPDFIVEAMNDEVNVYLNNQNIPILKVNRDFSEMMTGYNENRESMSTQDKQALVFMKQKVDAAKWFIEAVKQRQNTLKRTMEAIVKFQYSFFLTDDETELKPMKLKDIADVTGLDISTISRVSTSKYVQTNQGVYPLKYFFSEGMQTDSGEDVSTREIKVILRQHIEKENPDNPLTDLQLTDILNRKGYPIARRTVAKYREQLNIPVARLRKKI